MALPPSRRILFSPVCFTGLTEEIDLLQFEFTLYLRHVLDFFQDEFEIMDKYWLLQIAIFENLCTEEDQHPEVLEFFKSVHLIDHKDHPRDERSVRLVQLLHKHATFFVEKSFEAAEIRLPFAEYLDDYINPISSNLPVKEELPCLKFVFKINPIF